MSVQVAIIQSLPGNVEPAALVSDYLSSAVSEQLCSGHLVLKCEPAPLQLDVSHSEPSSQLNAVEGAPPFQAGFFGHVSFQEKGLGMRHVQW